MANPDAKGVPKPPPNLRVSDDENRECDSCTHYQRGKCALYNSLPVDGEWVCDSYAPSGVRDPDDVPGKNLRDAERNALVRVREHTRSRAAAKPN